jgi:hypothetical protein
MSEINKEAPSTASLNSESDRLGKNLTLFNQALDDLQSKTGIYITKLQKTSKGLGGIDDKSIFDTSQSIKDKLVMKRTKNIDVEIEKCVSAAINELRNTDKTLDGKDFYTQYSNKRISDAFNSNNKASFFINAINGKLNKNSEWSKVDCFSGNNVNVGGPD